MINERYKIIKRLGKGRSQVYLCSDIFNPSKNFAIKILSNSSNLKELKSFRNEYFLLKKLIHPNIVQTYEFGTVLTIDQDDLYESEIEEFSKFFTTDFFDGVPLDKFEKRDEINILYKIIEQICSVLYYLHQSNYIYYDLCPDNILIKYENDNLAVRFVDFNLTKFIPNNEPYEVQGTPTYIAPEIIQLTNVDHRADLYSFGILLYFLIYNQFPFKTENELVIYKANIEKEFEYPPKPGFENLINITKKLLHKLPVDRYNTALEILDDLYIPLSKQLINYWIPVKVFCGRKELIYDINSMIYNKSSQKVIVINGENGSGKSLLLEEINYNLFNSILIKGSDINAVYPFWKLLLNQIFYSETIYKNIDDKLKNEIRTILTDNEFEVIEKLKSIFFKISRDNKFELLLDDFSKYDVFSIEILKEIIPILQVNGIKIVIADENELSIISDLINDFETYNLKPFSKENLSECIEKSFFNFFPKEKLKQFIKENSDLLPGNVYNFIKDMVFLGILEYDYKKIIINKKNDSLNNINSMQSEINKIKVSDLSTDQLKVANIISQFDICLDLKSISILCGYNQDKVDIILSELRNKGIILNTNININPNISSQNLKDYIYNNIEDKKCIHLDTAKKIVNLIPNFNKIEIARQFELAGDFKSCYDILTEELRSAEKKSALSYQRKILNKLLAFPLSEENLAEVKYLLSKVLFKIGETKVCLQLTDELIESKFPFDQHIELLIQKGKSLNKLNLFDKGIKLLESILGDIENVTKKQDILIEIADAKLYLDDYDSVFSICRDIIEEKQSNDETKAKAYNLLGLLELNRSSNFAGAIYNFQYASSIYQKANLPFNVAGVELNIGNIINIKGNLNEAQKHWQASYEINESIGNLEHEAKLVMNYGVYYFQLQSYEKSIQQYKRAENIFSSLGYKFDRGLALINLGEVHLNICEYDFSLNYLRQAFDIFNELEDPEEEVEAIFLIGQCYFNLGDSWNLSETIKQFEAHSIKHNHSEKHKKYIPYLKHLLSFIKKDWNKVINEINDLMQLFLLENERESFYYFSKCNTIFIRALINAGNYDLAIRQLSEKNFLKVCEQNIVLKAEREFLLGVIAEYNSKFNFGPSVDFFSQAIQLIENQCILELTWEINFALAKFYFERNNFKKFSEFSSITKSLLNFISKKISSKSARELYLSSLQRGIALECLENFEKSINE